MQTIEYRTIDKSAWPRGPWDSEPDKKQWQDPATGLPCLIKRNEALGIYCGYVGVPAGHPLYGLAASEKAHPDLRVHGGVTFDGALCSHGDEATSICHKPDPGEPDDVWWIGFDCGHYLDLVPTSNYRAADSKYRDLAYVTREVEHLAEQLASAGR